MTYTSRPTSMLPSVSSTGSSFRQPSTHHAAPQQQLSALAARIASKKAELDNLKQLREMSGALAMQMQVLEEKIGTLKDGTEGRSCDSSKNIKFNDLINYARFMLMLAALSSPAVACVLANWDNVLRSISMASTEAVTVQRPTVQNPNTLSEGDKSVDTPMPATLVRIPADQAASARE
ncbi:DASH complex subunit DAD2 [Aspergillus flavus]|nr:DASH complex subunit DAD2 [Aspergillus flavus]